MSLYIILKILSLGSLEIIMQIVGLRAGCRGEQQLYFATRTSIREVWIICVETIYDHVLGLVNSSCRP